MAKDQRELYQELLHTRNLTEIQSYVNEVLKIRVGEIENVQDELLLLTEEVGELAKAVRKKLNKTIDYARLDNYEPVESEIADVLFVLLSICNVLNVDIYEAMITKEAKNLERKWS